MSEPKIKIEATMLKDLDTFKETLLPLINNNRKLMEEPELITEDEIINCFLDLRLEMVDNTSN